MKRLLKVVVALCCLSVLTGCATIVSGRSQTISLETNPAGARCEVEREGRVIGTVEKTPGAVTIDKTRQAISVACKKEGYGDSTGRGESGVQGSVFGNILLGGLIGWGVDAATGAQNQYPSVITVNLAAADGSPPSTAAVTPAVVPKTDTQKRLETLARLKKDGVLTEHEYNKKRAEIVSSL